jgi:hypothetical protein
MNIASPQEENDLVISKALADGVLTYDHETGNVFAIRSNTPSKPVGAKTKKGYLRTCVTINGKPTTLMVHRIACIAAHGMPEAEQFVNHINGIKTDNRAVNIEWVSHVENMAHSRLHGLHKGTGRKDGIRDSKGRFGKKAAGRLLDGVTHNEFPKVAL